MCTDSWALATETGQLPGPRCRQCAAGSSKQNQLASVCRIKIKITALVQRGALTIMRRAQSSSSCLDSSRSVPARRWTRMYAQAGDVRSSQIHARPAPHGRRSTRVLHQPLQRRASPSSTHQYHLLPPRTVFVGWLRTGVHWHLDLHAR